MPRVSVIIPAGSCACRQIRAVHSQLEGSDELIIVGTREALTHCRSNCAALRTAIWLITDNRLNPAESRNRGAGLAANSEALLFCDSDDQVAPGWKHQLSRPLLEGKADVVTGLLRVSANRRHPQIVRPRTDYFHYQAIFGGNSGFRQTAWKRLKGFDPMFCCCEDTDIGWRAIELGLRLEIVHGAIVNISTKRAFEEFKQRWSWGFWATRLLKKHSLPRTHIPPFRLLLNDISSIGYASHPRLAAFAQFLGFLTGEALPSRAFSDDPK